MKTLKTTIQILFLTISLNTYSQIVFNNTYDMDSLYNGFRTQIELTNGDFVAADQISTSFNEYFGSYISRIDPFGDVIWEKKIDLFEGGLELIGDIKQIDDNIYALGVGLDTLKNILNGFIYKMNLNGDSIYSNILTDSLGSVMVKFIHRNEHFYVLEWFYPDNNDSENIDVSIVKIDTLGNRVSEWMYNAPKLYACTDFKVTEEFGFILSGFTNSFNIDNNLDFLLIKLDSLGNIEWQNTYGTANDETTRSYNYLESTLDGGYIILGEEDIVTPFFHQRTVILKVDSLGNQLWRKNLQLNEQTYAKSLREWHDGSIIITGGTVNYDTIIPFLNTVRSYLIKLSADGQTETWSRYFSSHWLESDEYVRGITLTSDGGILTSGGVGSSFTRNDAWLTKFDSCGYTLGDVPTPFFVVDSIEKTKYEHKVFISEQSQDYCTAEIDWGDGSDITKYYAYENNLPLQEKQLQHTYTENGTYTIKTTALAGEEYRTYEVEIEVNGISVGINSVIAAQAGISLFPNPADEFVIIENINSFVIPAQAGISNVSEVSFLQWNNGLVLRILDINGKLIKKIVLNPKLYQQKLDISSLNNGVYFVKFEMGDVLLGTEKLVVAR